MNSNRKITFCEKNKSKLHFYGKWYIMEERKNKWSGYAGKCFLGNFLELKDR